MPQKRYSYRCPICKRNFKRITPHIKGAHIDLLGSSYKCSLFGAYARLPPDFRLSGCTVKVCPVSHCPSIVGNVPRHLRDVHTMTRGQSLEYSKRAKKVTDLDWSVHRRPHRRHRRTSISFFRGIARQVLKDRRIIGLERRNRSRSRRVRTSPVESLAPRVRPLSPTISSRSSPSPDRQSILDVGLSSAPLHTSTPLLKTKGVKSKLMFQFKLPEKYMKHLMSPCGGGYLRDRAREYALCIQRYLLFLGTIVMPQKNIKESEISRYTEHLLSLGRQPGTILSTITTVKNFGKYLVKIHRLSGSQ